MATQHFEFFGPHGPALLLVALPAVPYTLLAICNQQGCLQLPALKISGLPWDQPLFSVEALLVWLGWLLCVLLLHVLLPGKRQQGVLLATGSQLTYKLNAFAVFLAVYPAAAALVFLTPYLPLSWVAGNYLPLLTASTLCSIALALYLYATSFKKGAHLASAGATGYPLYDFWMGRELNPRVGPLLDLKHFCELYPGMIGWGLLNLAFMQQQVVETGRVTNSMLLVNAFELFYIVDSLWNERSILTTMDIATDGFGFMLAFGDLTWVPFVFSQQARFLALYPQDLSPWPVAVVLGVQALGYYIFRGANGQKDAFRRNPTHPSVAHLRTLETRRGTRLIISGWWGTARHINYLGDFIMGIAWCLPCWLAGLRAIAPYFYCVYFGALLVHRERRDEHACRLKYGKDWDKYCSLVKYRIVPYVY